MVGGHPEGDDFAGFGRDGGLGAQPREFRAVLEHVVGRENRDHRPGRARRRPGGSRPDRRRAVATLRLEQDRRLGPDLLQLLGDAEAVVEIGDDGRRIEDRPIADQADDRLDRNVDRSPISGMNCLGRLSRDSGQTRCPSRRT